MGESPPSRTSGSKDRLCVCRVSLDPPMHTSAHRRGPGTKKWPAVGCTHGTSGRSQPLQEHLGSVIKPVACGKAMQAIHAAGVASSKAYRSILGPFSNRLPLPPKYFLQTIPLSSGGEHHALLCARAIPRGHGRRYGVLLGHGTTMPLPREAALHRGAAPRHRATAAQQGVRDRAGARCRGAAPNHAVAHTTLGKHNLALFDSTAIASPAHHCPGHVGARGLP
jgi:hypothetical protein